MYFKRIVSKQLKWQRIMKRICFCMSFRTQSENGSMSKRENKWRKVFKVFLGGNLVFRPCLKHVVLRRDQAAYWHCFCARPTRPFHTDMPYFPSTVRQLCILFHSRNFSFSMFICFVGFNDFNILTHAVDYITFSIAENNHYFGIRCLISFCPLQSVMLPPQIYNFLKKSVLLWKSFH